MAKSFLQSNLTATAAASTTVAKAFATLTAGSLLCCFVYAGSTPTITVSVADSANGAWTQAFQETGNYNISGHYFVNNGSTGTPTVTATASSSTNLVIEIFEIGGITAGGLLDQTKDVSTASTNPTTGDCATLAESEEAAVCWLTKSGSNAATAGTSGDPDWTNDSTVTFGHWHRCERKITSADTAFAGDWSCGTSLTYTVAMMLFKAGAGGGGVSSWFLHSRSGVLGAGVH